MTGGGDDDPVRGIADRVQRNGFEQNFKRIGLNKKVRRATQFLRPAAKRNGKFDHPLFYQANSFFENNDGDNDGVLSLFYTMEKPPRSFAEPLFSVGGVEDERMGIGDVNHLRFEISLSIEFSLSCLISFSARSRSPTSFMLPLSLRGACFTVRR